MTKKQLMGQWKKDVSNRARDVDPSDERDWFDMAVGYFIAKGVTINRAYDLAHAAIDMEE